MSRPIPAASAVISLSLLATPVLAATGQGDTCQGVSCFNQPLAAANNELLRQAPKFAWRPGHYQQNKKRRGSYRRGTGRSMNWFVSVPRRGPANGRGTIVFSPRNLTWAAYDSSGSLVRSGRAVGGMGYCPDVGRSCRTPVGRFRVYRKGPANCVSRKYPLGVGGAPMPHCMYFRGGYALHGSYHVPNYNASHGCIRVHPGTAAWLHRNFVKVGTVVVVKPY